MCTHVQRDAKVTVKRIISLGDALKRLKAGEAAAFVNYTPRVHHMHV